MCLCFGRLEERLDSTTESLSAEIATVGVSTATASADSAGQAALEEQLAALDRKFSDANAAQASWLEQQLAQSSRGAAAQISAVELSIQTALLEAEGKTVDAVAKLERSLASTAAGMEETIAGVDERIATMEEGMEAGIGDRCDELQNELDQFSAIVLAMKGGQDATRDKLVRLAPSACCVLPFCRHTPVSHSDQNGCALRRRCMRHSWKNLKRPDKSLRSRWQRAVGILSS